MPDFPGSMLPGDHHSLAISTLSMNALGPCLIGTAMAAVAWPAADRAIMVPFRVATRVTVYKMACGTGTGTTGNFNLGIVDVFGNHIVSTGSTAKSVASEDRLVDVTDTTFGPGMFYLAMVADSTDTYIGRTNSNVAMTKLMGLREAAGSFTLSSGVTLATVSTAFVPAISAYLRPW